MSQAIQGEKETAASPRSWWRMLAAGLMVLAGVGILAFTMQTSNAANKDFVTYWAAARQILHHANPYDGPEILRLERAAGCMVDKPYFMRNPPTALFIALPFGWMSERAAVLVWSLLLVTSVMASVRMIWRMEGRMPGGLQLTGYMFPPVLVCLTVGQVGILLLLGFAGFLFLYERRPFAAGMSLVLCSLKPHVVLAAGLALLVWSVRRREYRVLAGLATGLAACATLAWAADPQIWMQYLRMLRAAGMMDEQLPTLSLLLRVAVDTHMVWLQFVPAALAAVWAMWYARRPDWTWNDGGLLVVAVSVMAAPYAFVTDEAIVLPALLHALFTLARERRSLVPFACVLLPGLVEALAGKPVASFWYIWTAPAWVGFHIYARRVAKLHTAGEAAVA